MKNTIYLILAIQLILSSCSIHKSLAIGELKGKYLWNESFFDVSESLEIFSDSTFTFQWKQGLIGGYTNGKCSIDNGEIKLYSEFSPDTHEFNLIVPPQTKQEYYEILVRDQYSNRLIAANCIAFENGELMEGSITDELGICKLPIEDVDSIAIEYLGYKDAGFKTIKNTSPKSIIIEMADADNYYYFTGEPLMVSNNNKVKIKTFGRNKTFERIKN